MSTHPKKILHKCGSRPLVDDVSDYDESRLIWQCHRGMLELDLILQSFVKHGYQKLTAAQKTLFQSLLALDDPQLLRWLLGHAKPDDASMAELVSLVRSSYPVRD